jgi:F1F0 ATPase subunit 2
MATMAEVGRLAIPLLAGVGLGLFYFGGLWLTLQRIATTRQPGLLAMGSFLIRTVVAVAGFYLVADGRWERLVVALAGFLLARTVLTRRWRPQFEKPWQ